MSIRKIRKTVSLEDTPEIRAFLAHQSNFSASVSLLIKQAYYQNGGPDDVYKLYFDNMAKFFTGSFDERPAAKASPESKNESHAPDVSSVPLIKTAKSKAYTIPEGY